MSNVPHFKSFKKLQVEQKSLGKDIFRKLVNNVCKFWGKAVFANLKKPKLNNF